MSDPYRDEVEVLRERLEDLEERHAELHEKVRLGTIKLQQASDSARVAEKKQGRTSVQGWMLLAGFVIFFSFLTHDLFGWIGTILFLCSFSGIALAVRLDAPWSNKKLFEPEPYGDSTVPTHLRAESDLLEQDSMACKALEEEIAETVRMLAEHGVSK